MRDILPEVYRTVPVRRVNIGDKAHVFSLSEKNDEIVEEKKIDENRKTRERTEWGAVAD